MLWVSSQRCCLQAIKTTEMQFPSSVSPSARDWVRAALVVDVQQRASIATLLNHPWIQSHRLPDTAEAGASVSSPASASPSQTAAITPESVQKALLERRHVHNQDPTDLVRNPSGTRHHSMPTCP
jgi:serine/threonine protein kinase